MDSTLFGLVSETEINVFVRVEWDNRVAANLLCARVRGTEEAELSITARRAGSGPSIMSCVWHCHLPDHVQPCAQHWWFLRRGRGRGLQCRARSMDRGRLTIVRGGSVAAAAAAAAATRLYLARSLVVPASACLRPELSS